MACNNTVLYQEKLSPDAFTCDENGLIRPALTLEEYGAYFFDDMWGYLAGSWITRVSTGSRNPISRDNGWFEFTTGVTATNEESIDFNDFLMFNMDKDLSYRTRIQLDSIADVEFEIGLVGATTNDYVRFLYDASSGITDWRIQASNAGSATSVTTAQAVTTDEVVLHWRYQYDSDTIVEFYIDGVLVGSIGTNMPIALLQPYILIRTETAAEKKVYVDYVKVAQERT